MKPRKKLPPAASLDPISRVRRNLYQARHRGRTDMYIPVEAAEILLAHWSHTPSEIRLGLAKAKGNRTIVMPYYVVWTCLLEYAEAVASGRASPSSGGQNAETCQEPLR